MRVLLIILNLSFLVGLQSQNTLQFGALPNINLNKKINNVWKINTKIESRQKLNDKFLNDFLNYEYLLTDLTFIASKKMGFNNSFSLGFLARFKGGEFINRAIQQFTIIDKLGNNRMAHRFTTDQTFGQNIPTSYRIRYRIGIEIPLNGSSLDVREFYLKLNNEYLNALSNDLDYDLEIRLTPFIGYVFKESNKLELGFDYRLDSFINDISRNRLWLGINWYLAI